MTSWQEIEFTASLSLISQVRKNMMWYDETRIANNRGIDINLKTTQCLIFKRHFLFAHTNLFGIECKTSVSKYGDEDVMILVCGQKSIDYVS